MVPISLSLRKLFTSEKTRDFQKRLIDLRTLYEELKNKKINSRKGISNYTEEKIIAAIEFINENYQSDLVREDIASAVEMNPNYFSSKFKEYTGKKINEYINELRVKDAAKLLEDRDVRVVDIAFKTGFDSLATFNRVFKAITDKTPSEFRNNLS